MSELIVGIDVGGTFTDVVAADFAQGSLIAVKVPSQPAQPAAAFLDGLQQVLDRFGEHPSAVARIVHGTTIATNAILEHKGATLGILVTRGFEDILAIGRMKRSEMYNLNMDAEEPLFLAPRRRIVGIPERIDGNGRVVEPLDEAVVMREVARLRRDYEINALAVCYLFSFLNPDHELRTGALLREHFPDLPFSLSATIEPKFREYERLVVTAFDAYLRPTIDRYLAALEEELRSHGFVCPLQIMQSNGGITSARTAADRPVVTILSGPAAGVVAGLEAGRDAGFQDLVTLDMGGTSFDVALLLAGRIETRSEGRIGKYPLRVPMVDVHTIGAGGGSISFVDPGGGLKVGPESAAALPGPACYGQGGTEATVTDASLLLGYLNPGTYAGGKLKLHPELAREAISGRIAGPLKLDPVRAASGIHDIVNTQMAEAVRLVSVRRGYDLRGIALVAMGGAGPIHAGRLLKLLDAKAVVIPVRPGVASALGLLMSDIRHELSRAHPRKLRDARVPELVALYSEIDERCGELMRSDGFSPTEVLIQRYAEMRYVGQSYELDIPVSQDLITDQSVTELADSFHTLHKKFYGHQNLENDIEILALRSVHLYRLPVLPKEIVTRTSGSPIATGSRQAYFAETRDYAETPVYDRFAIPVGSTIEGPAILDQEDTTTVVYPGQTATVHNNGSVIIIARAEGASR